MKTALPLLIQVREEMIRDLSSGGRRPGQLGEDWPGEQAVSALEEARMKETDEEVLKLRKDRSLPLETK